MDKMIENAFVGDANTGEVVGGGVIISVEHYEWMKVQLAAADAAKEAAKELEKKFRKNERTGQFVKQFREEMLLTVEMPKRDLYAWTAIKLSLRKEKEFIYLRPTALVKTMKSLLNRDTELTEASRSIAALRKARFIIPVGRDLYMINHKMAFNGNMDSIIKQHKGFDIFDCKEDYVQPQLDLYLSKIGFDYASQLYDAASYIEGMTKMKGLLSQTAESDIQDYLERTKKTANDNVKKNKEKFGGK